MFGYEEALGYAVCDEVRDKDGISAAALLVQLVVALRAEGSSLADRLDDLARRHGVHATGQVTVRFPPAEAAAGPAAATDRLRRNPPADVAGLTVVAVTDYLTPSVAESEAAGQWIPASAGMTVEETPDPTGEGIPALDRSPGHASAGMTMEGTPGPDQSLPTDNPSPPTDNRLPATDMLVFGLGGGDRVIVRPSGTEPKLKVYVEAVEDVTDGGLAGGPSSWARPPTQDRRGNATDGGCPTVVVPRTSDPGAG